MRIMFTIVKRNMLNYFFDKTSIFFSFLSVLILLLVYVLFLGQLQIDNVIELVGAIPGIEGLTLSWLISGLVITSTVTVSLSTMSDIVSDKQNKMLDDFYVAPIPRSSIVVAYMISSIVITILMASLTFMLGMVYVGLTTSIWLTFFDALTMLGVISLSSTLFASMAFFIMTMVKTISAAGTINTLVGTLIGFFAGIYVPFGAFSETFQTIMQLNPAAQVVALMRQIMTQPYLDTVFQGAPIDVIESYKHGYGITLTLFEMELSPFGIIMFSLGWTLFFFSLSLLRVRSNKALR